MIMYGCVSWIHARFRWELKEPMTDPIYDNLDTLIGELKRSAIDAYMHDHEYTVSGSSYEEVAPNRSVGESVVERPQEDGSGGGKEVIYFTDGPPSKSEGYSDTFDEIRHEIDSRLKKWKNLPNPREIEIESSKCLEVTKVLASTATTQNGLIVPAGMVIPANLELIGHKLRSMKGETADAIQAKFLTALSAAVGNLNRVSIYLGGALVAEEKVFSAAREAVAKAVHEAKEVCDKVARGDGSEMKIAVNIAKLVADGIAAFTGPLGAAYKATTIGAGVSSVALGGIDASKVESSGEVKSSDVKSYDQALTALDTALDAINLDIRNGESALSANIVDNIDIITGNRSAFDLSFESIRSKEKLLIVVPEDAMAIAKSHLPPIAEELSKTARSALGFSMTTAVMRDEGVGIGPKGPGEMFASMRTLLYELLRELAWDVENGAANLRSAIELIENEDANSKAALEQSARNIDKGSRIDPWNHHQTWDPHGSM